MKLLTTNCSRIENAGERSVGVVGSKGFDNEVTVVDPLFVSGLGRGHEEDVHFGPPLRTCAEDNFSEEDRARAANSPPFGVSRMPLRGLTEPVQIFGGS